MQPRFEQFISEKQYLTNITPATVSWNTFSLRWLTSESPTQTSRRVGRCRVADASKRTESNRVQLGNRAINAYLQMFGVISAVKSIAMEPRTC